MRAKMKLESIRDSGGQDAKQLTFRAVTDDGTPENERYHRYTPCGTVEMTVDNPKALEGMAPGDSFYVDFTKAE